MSAGWRCRRQLSLIQRCYQTNTFWSIVLMVPKSSQFFCHRPLLRQKMTNIIIQCILCQNIQYFLACRKKNCAVYACLNLVSFAANEDNAEFYDSLEMPVIFPQVLRKSIKYHFAESSSPMKTTCTAQVVFFFQVNGFFMFRHHSRSASSLDTRKCSKTKPTMLMLSPGVRYQVMLRIQCHILRWSSACCIGISN